MTTPPQTHNPAAEVIEQSDRYRWRSGQPVETLTDVARWFLSHCQAQRRSINTIKTYRNGINSIGLILADLRNTTPGKLALDVFNRDDLADAFNEYATRYAPASQSQAWTIWNGMSELLVGHEFIERNPMTQVPSASGRKAVTVPKTLPHNAVEALLDYLAKPEDTTVRQHKNRWRERDYAMILLFLVTGMRESELVGLNMGDVNALHNGDGGRVLLVRGKGNKERSLTIEAPVVKVLTEYLETRYLRQPVGARRSDDPWDRWATNEPLFVNAKGQRMTRQNVYYAVETAYKKSGIIGYRSEGALVHQLRHTLATNLADDPEVTIFQLKQLLGHSSLSATERYTAGAGRQTRAAARRNPVYGLLDK